MWKYFTNVHNKEFILSLDLIKGTMNNAKKLNLLYAIANNNKKYYTKKYILKANGTKRELLVPNKILKSIQRNILRNVIGNLSVSPYVTSYIPGKTIIDNAKPHLNQKVLLKLDIKDFFKNIDFEMLYRILPNYIFPPSVKVILLKLCTYDDYLPGGAPTIPMLSNLVLKSFDNYIGNYCEKNNINYTRYCDDLTFSGDFNTKAIIKKVENFLNEFGFTLNKAKTKIITRSNRQIVTGIIVNNKLNAPASYRQKIRQEMYYINKYGVNNHFDKIGIPKNKGISNLKGRINYCLQINSNDKEMQKYLRLLQK